MRRFARFALLTFALIAIGTHAVADEPARTGDYEVTLSLSDAFTLMAGNRLSKSDPQRCEKTRDICLAAMCGSFERGNVVPGCWNYCTETKFDQCKAE